MFELKGEYDDFKEIHYEGKRIGSIWDNRDDTITVKINPKFWRVPHKILDTSYHYPQEWCIIVGREQ